MQRGTWDTLHPGGIDRTEGSLGRKLEARIRSLRQAQQARFESRSKLSGAQSERRRAVTECVDPVTPVLRGEAVMQGQQGIGMYTGHSL